MKRRVIVFVTAIFCLMSSYTVNAQNNIRSILYMVNNIVKMITDTDIPIDSLEQNEGEIEMTDISKAYAILFDSVYDIDPGLNGNVKYISIDVSTFENFSDDDKESLFSYIENKYNVKVLDKNFEQLKDEGYVQDLYFEEGILFLIEDYYENDENAISVNAEKWRSGLGAIWVDAEVTKENNEWILKKADMTAIS